MAHARLCLTSLHLPEPVPKARRGSREDHPDEEARCREPPLTNRLYRNPHHPAYSEIRCCRKPTDAQRELNRVLMQRRMAVPGCFLFADGQNQESEDGSFAGRQSLLVPFPTSQWLEYRPSESGHTKAAGAGCTTGLPDRFQDRPRIGGPPCTASMRRRRAQGSRLLSARPPQSARCGRCEMSLPGPPASRQYSHRSPARRMTVRRRRAGTTLMNQMAPLKRARRATAGA